MQKRIEKNHLSAAQGLVISYFGNSVAVEADDGQVFQCHLHRNQELPVVGDRVRWQLESGDVGSVVGIQPRRSLLSRGDGRGGMKPIAANVDMIMIVMAPPPVFSDYLVDRYLVAAELLNIEPILVLNKMDLLNDSTRQAALDHLVPYRNIPYPIILSSVYSKDGLEELGVHLKNKAAVLIGPSGVGKSSIIAALSNKEAIRIGDVTSKGGGKHTTTASRLYHLPQGGTLIDSPGVREFNLWLVSQQDLLRGFREFQQFLGGCKFRDCLHLSEPGCAVQAAVASGKIGGERFANYQKLMRETSSNRK